MCLSLHPSHNFNLFTCGRRACVAMNELVRLIYLTGRESNPQKGKGENPPTALPAIVAGSVSAKTSKNYSIPRKNRLTGNRTRGPGASQSLGHCHYTTSLNKPSGPKHREGYRFLKS